MTATFIICIIVLTVLLVVFSTWLANEPPKRYDNAKDCPPQSPEEQFYAAAVGLFYASGVAMHAEGHPGLKGCNGDGTGGPPDADTAYYEAGLVTLMIVSERIKLGSGIAAKHIPAEPAALTRYCTNPSCGAPWSAANNSSTCDACGAGQALPVEYFQNFDSKNSPVAGVSYQPHWP